MKGSKDQHKALASPAFPIDFEQIHKELEASPNKSYKFWTPEEDQILRDFYQKRAPVLITEKLKRTTQAIEQRANRLGLARRMPLKSVTL